MIAEFKNDQLVLRAESDLESYYFKHFFGNIPFIEIQKDEDVLGVDVNCIRLMPVKECGKQLKN
jgi:hypothetical protein